MRKAKPTQAERIRQYLKANPDMSVSEIAKLMGVKYQIVYMTKRTMQDKEKKLPKNTITVSTVEDRRHPVTGKALMQAAGQPIQIEMFEPKPDPVNHPAHYKVGGIETIDFIEAKKLNYNLGNAVKYITRADYKGNRKQDLEKALWYIKRELSAV